MRSIVIIWYINKEPVAAKMSNLLSKNQSEIFCRQPTPFNILFDCNNLFAGLLESSSVFPLAEEPPPETGSMLLGRRDSLW